MAGPTLSELQAAIQAHGYGTDTAAAQTVALNSCLRRIYGMRNWKFLEKSGQLTATTGQNTVSLSPLTDLRRIDAARIEFGTDYFPLDYKERQAFRDLEHTDRDNGTPLYWTDTFNGELRLWPRPDKAYTLDLDYIYTPADLVNGSDTAALPHLFLDLPVWGAIRELAFRERDWFFVGVAQQDYQARLVEMIAQDGQRQRQTAGRVVRSEFWGDADPPQFPPSWS